MPGTLMLSTALDDIATERARQIDIEGYDIFHDDEHHDGSLAGVAACYAIMAQRQAQFGAGAMRTTPPVAWPIRWLSSFWKPKDSRRNLVIAGALIVAEIERLDRASAKKDADGRPDEQPAAS